MDNTNSIMIDKSISNTENAVRVCISCKKEFKLNQLKGNYHSKYQEYLKKVWDNPKIDFFCTGCFFIHLLNIIKKINGSKEIK